ncbi:uncharacterized protein LOC106152893 isoform X2 [Lingula anatina]|uniref:Uncharacterized protein LOC106152893 isoform X2 n=1 Tax=Lingula anatina TaxID=7574 RepID=A0A1S3H7Y0_LINAN|nr:uncharacterized protein LOC106152893 isoform X2 [Lingula anatina]|eukprot:XP_013382087.1 uncharacterized protein LOC106152893 isoform X2 [Lingula anatina]
MAEPLVTGTPPKSPVASFFRRVFRNKGNEGPEGYESLSDLTNASKSNQKVDHSKTDADRNSSGNHSDEDADGMEGKTDADKEEERQIPKVAPPSPRLDHLNAEEIGKLTNVFKKLETMEQEEKEFVKNQQERRDSMNDQVSLLERQQEKKTVRLCMLCDSATIWDGVGRACHFCKKRACSKCRTYVEPPPTGKAWNITKYFKGYWVCNVCYLNLDVLQKTGKWCQTDSDEGEEVPVRTSADFFKKVATDWGPDDEFDGCKP